MLMQILKLSMTLTLGLQPQLVLTFLPGHTNEETYDNIDIMSMAILNSRLFL